MPLKAPAYLAKDTQSWVGRVLRTYELEEHHFKLLLAAAEAWDRCQQARAVLKREGAYFKDRFGQPKAHPALAVERDARVQFARLMRELDLDGEPLPDPRPRRN